MGTVTNSIGTASRDYSTIALWEAALPASAVTAGNSYVGECYNDSEFNLGSTQTVIAGTTTDSTHTITLTTGPGQGFKDNASAATNALRYNVSNGVGIKGGVPYDFPIKITDNFVTVQNLQFLGTASNGQGSFQVGGDDFEADNCIFQSTGATNANSGNVFLDGNRNTVKNSLVVCDTSNGLVGIRGVFGGSLINNTVVRPSDKTTGGEGINCRYGSWTIQNCVIAGFTTAIDSAATKTGSGNAIDGASYPTGPTGQTSLTIATEFVQPSNASSVMDWRLKSTSVACKDNGTNSGAPTTDIIGQSISNSIRDVGCWELQQSGGGGGGAVSHRLSLMGAGA